MAALELALANEIITQTLGMSSEGGAVIASVPPLRIRFMESNGTPAEPGLEVTPSNQEGGYIGGPLAPMIDFALPVAGASSNTNDITVTAMPECVIAGVEIWDSGGEAGQAVEQRDPATGEVMLDEQGQPILIQPEGEGTRRWFGALTTPKPVNEGDTFTIVTGSLTVTLA